MTFVASVTLGEVWMLTWSAEQLAAAGTTAEEAIAEVRDNQGDVLQKASASAAETNRRWVGDPIVRAYACGDHVHVAVTGQLIDVDPDVPLVLWDKNHPVYVALIAEYLTAQSAEYAYGGKMMVFGCALTLTHEDAVRTNTQPATYVDVLAAVDEDLERAVNARLDAINQAKETP